MTMHPGAGHLDSQASDCLVQYRPATGLPLDEKLGERLALQVELTTREWRRTTCSFLGLPEPSVTVTLDAGARVPMTRGREIVLPVRATDAAAVEADLRSLSHELVHAVVGRSPSLVLNEGLAVHVDATLRLGGSAWPFFHLPPHRWVEVIRTAGAFIPLAQLVSPPPMRLSAATAGRLTRFYLEAGSFCAFLLGSVGPAAFWRAYAAGSPLAVGRTPNEMEEGWLGQIGGPLTAEERRLKERSEQELARIRPGWAVGGPGVER